MYSILELEKKLVIVVEEEHRRCYSENNTTSNRRERYRTKKIASFVVVEAIDDVSQIGGTRI